MMLGKIMVVDDEPSVREIIKLHLEQKGFLVLEAGDGEQALNLLMLGSNLVSVGMVLCDIRMPKVNGIEVFDYLKKEAPSIPVVVITGYPDTQMAINLLKSGVKDYLVKPIEKEKLLETVESVMAVGRNYET